MAISQRKMSGESVLNTSLWDTLLGKPMDIIASIKTHLQFLLNIRQGSLHHLPDYGLPDLTTLYLGLPSSQRRLVQAIQHQIERYEPRLQHLTLQASLLAQTEPILCIEMHACLPNQQAVGIETYWYSQGYAQVEAKPLELYDTSN